MHSFLRNALLGLLILPIQVAVAEIKMAFDEIYAQTAPYAFDDFKEAYSRIGEQVSFAILPGRRAIAMANGGQYQALDARYLGSESISELLPVMVPIYSELRTYVCGLTESDLTIKSMDELAAYSVAGVRGNTFNLTLQKQLADFHLVEDEATALRMIETNRVQLALITDVGFLRLQALGVGQNVELKSDVLYRKYLYHHIHKSHAHLIPELEKVIAAMKSEGKFIER